MTVTITDAEMTSDRTTALLVRLPDSDRWVIAAYPVDIRFRFGLFTRDQATTAMAYAEHLAIYDPGHTPGHSDHHCAHLDAWAAELLTAPNLTDTPAHALSCLYCGSPDDIFEVLVTVDERTSEFAMQCALCGGVWAP